MGEGYLERAIAAAGAREEMRNTAEAESLEREAIMYALIEIAYALRYIAQGAVPR